MYFIGGSFGRALLRGWLQHIPSAAKAGEQKALRAKVAADPAVARSTGDTTAASGRLRTMKPTILGLVSAAAVLSSHFLGAQSPPQSGLIRDVAASPFTLVARADGSVMGWGYDPNELGVKTAPVVIDLPGKALKVAVGGDTANAYALLEDGTVVAWGANDEGQLGNGPSGANGILGIYPKRSATPVRVTGLADIIEIEAGRKHAVALRKDGTVWAWGTRDDGALGGGDARPRRPSRCLGSRASRRSRWAPGTTSR
jgi:hypothetical protein